MTPRSSELSLQETVLLSAVLRLAARHVNRYYRSALTEIGEKLTGVEAAPAAGAEEISADGQAWPPNFSEALTMAVLGTATVDSLPVTLSLRLASGISRQVTLVHPSLRFDKRWLVVDGSQAGDPGNDLGAIDHAILKAGRLSDTDSYADC